MSDRRLEELLYDSAAALRRVHRELQDLDALDSPRGAVARETKAASSSGAGRRNECARDSRAEMLEGLGRVRLLLHGMRGQQG